jgi:hypothetical protein
MVVPQKIKRIAIKSSNPISGCILKTNTETQRGICTSMFTAAFTIGEEVTQVSPEIGINKIQYTHTREHHQP